MTNLLGAAASEGSNIGQIIMLVFLLIIAVAYIVLTMRNRKKQQEQALKMLDELKVGDKVVTHSGIYGEIVAIRETNMGKVLTIKTGEEDGKKFGFVSVNANFIYGIDSKQDLVLDADGNVIDPEEAKEEVLKEEFKEEKTEEEAEDEKETLDLEKPKKKTAKKSTAKKSTEKKETKKAEKAEPANA
ncbi:MAG: preprotein translocase subunit YajC [Clostridia bacterium]|nr:preprotein translocase subunit YajC [Clostridia bacterium]